MADRAMGDFHAQIAGGPVGSDRLEGYTTS